MRDAVDASSSELGSKSDAEPEPNSDSAFDSDFAADSAPAPTVRAKDDERVLVVPTTLVRRAAGDFEGFSTTAVRACESLFAPSATRFLRRGDAERDPEFKQLIPYILFAFTALDGRVSVFAYRRGAGQGEARLRSKRSVGVGGHINDGDVGTFDANGAARSLFDAGARREIAEEVVLGADVRAFERVGLVNDDSTEVGRVHLGVVCRVELSAPELRSNEPDLIEAGFRDVGELLDEIDANPDDFESWTVLALRGLYPRDESGDSAR